MSIRPVKRLIKSKPTLEGAGVHLRRAFGFGNTSDFDPFLLLDDFRNDVPADYLAGFPWHPHRGIETITYVLAGTVDHGDSMGNRGSIASGDVQWMTAGSGIIHQEMPRGDQAGRMHGFQLWANLPASLKMTARRCAWSAEHSGERPAPSTALPPIPSISMCPCPRDSERRFPSKRRATRSLTYSRARANSAMRRDLSKCRPSRSVGRTRILPQRPKTVRSCSSIEAMKSWCRPATTASAFYSSRENLCKSPWHGMAP